MSYTNYPDEAKEFTTNANKLKEYVDNTITGLNETGSILSSCSTKDLLVSKSTEALNDILSMITIIPPAITSDIDKVNRIANDLENEEAQKALKKQEENGD